MSWVGIGEGSPALVRGAAAWSDFFTTLAERNQKGMFDYREADEKTSSWSHHGCFFMWLGELGLKKIEWTTGEEDRPR